MAQESFSIRPIGIIRSTLRALNAAPRQASEGAPDAWFEVDPTYARALLGIAAGDELVVVTWLHRADRNVMEVHPRDDPANLQGYCKCTRWFIWKRHHQAGGSLFRC